MGGQRHAPTTLPLGKTRYPLYRRLGGPQDPSRRVRNISAPPGSDPRTVQPVASSYTDWAIPALILYCVRAQKTINEATPAMKTWKIYRPTFALRSARSGFQIPIGQGTFLFSRKRSDRVWVPPTLLLKRYRGYFAEVKLTTHLHLVSRLRMSGAIPVLNL